MADIHVGKVGGKSLLWVSGWHCWAWAVLGMWCTESTDVKSSFFFLFINIINNSVSSGFSGEIFWNPNLNRTIRIFHLSIRDQPSSGFGAARGPSVRAGRLMRVTGHPYSSDYSVPEFLIIITRSPSVLYYEITCGLYSVTASLWSLCSRCRA